MLVFGVGNDTRFWLSLNKRGYTFFIEDDQDWLDKVSKENPTLKFFLTKYNTRLSKWKELINQPGKLSMRLNEKIRETRWDVVLVDAPRGWEPEHPGRMKSIYEASRLVKKGGHVFVHDCHREVEQHYADKYLCDKNLIETVENLRHYLMK